MFRYENFMTDMPALNSIKTLKNWSSIADTGNEQPSMSIFGNNFIIMIESKFYEKPADIDL